jgi:hypothetical protein
MADAKQDNRITIKDVRIAYAQGIFEARAGVAGPDGKPGKPKYGAAFLFPASHPALKELSAAVIKAANGKWGAKADEMLKMLKAGDRLPVHSGDAKATSAGYAGNLYLNAGNLIRPLVLNADRTPLTAADGKPYSGCFVNVIVEIWAQDSQFGKRVNASLLGVQFVRDGERLAGGSVATADDFEPIPQVEGAAEGQASPESLFS